jgi:hypothetical protein
MDDDAYGDEEYDQDLRDALAMSMMQQQPSSHHLTGDVKTGDNDDIGMIAMMNNDNDGSQTLFDQQAFDALMWDAVTTTPNDKQRWICECPLALMNISRCLMCQGRLIGVSLIMIMIS